MSGDEKWVRHFGGGGRSSENENDDGKGKRSRKGGEDLWRGGASVPILSG